MSFIRGPVNDARCTRSGDLLVSRLEARREQNHDRLDKIHAMAELRRCETPVQGAQNGAQLCRRVGRLDIFVAVFRKDRHPHPANDTKRGEAVCQAIGALIQGVIGERIDAVVKCDSLRHAPRLCGEQFADRPRSSPANRGSRRRTPMRAAIGSAIVL